MLLACGNVSAGQQQSAGSPPEPSPPRYGVEDRELLAAIGEVVVDAAVLEYLIAVLAAVMEGRTRNGRAA